MGEKKVEAGEYLYREGDAADGAYTVVSGKVELLDITSSGEVRAGVADPGQIFGEVAVFDTQSVRPQSARAIEASVLTHLSAEEFQAQFAQCPAPIQPFLQIAFEKMKAVKVKSKQSFADAVNESDITTITIAPASEALKAAIKPIEIPVARLPFRIGGYPEGGEISRKDQVHLSIASQDAPLRVSRQHCEIVVENNTVVVVDLGSRFNTRVNGTIIGRGRGTYTAPLKKGANDVILGAADGPYKFTVTCK